MSSLALFISALPTPIGQLQIVFDEETRLRALYFENYHERLSAFLTAQYCLVGDNYTLTPHALPMPVSAAFIAYFAGELAALNQLPLVAGGTIFQQRIWAELRKIPTGTTISYAELAQRIGNPKAVRAVGLANGANPISIVIPCHRVIGAKGLLTGFSGGIERKRWLLEHEGAFARTLL